MVNVVTWIAQRRDFVEKEPDLRALLVFCNPQRFRTIRFLFSQSRDRLLACFVGELQLFEFGLSQPARFVDDFIEVRLDHGVDDHDRFLCRGIGKLDTEVLGVAFVLRNEILLQPGGWVSLLLEDRQLRIRGSCRARRIAFGLFRCSICVCRKAFTSNGSVRCDGPEAALT